MSYLPKFSRDPISNKSGSVTILTGLAIVVLIGAIGIALDFSRAYSVKSQLQAAADAAVLAAPDPNQTLALQKARAYFDLNAKVPSDTQNVDVNIQVTPNDITATATATVPTTLTKVFGFDSIPVSARARAMAPGSGKLEIALVLDVTGSMRSTMAELKNSATDLVQKVFAVPGASENVKVAVVPYVGAVNIGNNAQQMDWMDVTGAAQHHGRAFEYHWAAWKNGCAYTPSGSGGGSDPGPGVGGQDRTDNHFGSKLPKFADVINYIFGIGAARAQSLDPYVVDPNEDCYIRVPSFVNHFDLFDQMTNVHWKGCVEARPEPFDVTDEPPSNANPDSSFVPYFWPDEPDVDWSHNPDEFPNNYIVDAEGTLPTGYSFADYANTANTSTHLRVSAIHKYVGVAAMIDETAPDTLGPNAACPDPIVPLTNQQAAIESAINALSHWEGSGTVSSEGLMWGWRVLSPAIPFTEGSSDPDVKKVIILMTDGVNIAAEQGHSATYSDYTAYGTLARNERGITTYEGYREFLNERLSQACTNVKADNIEIYAVTFGELDNATHQIYSHCATILPMHFKAVDATALANAFSTIATDVARKLVLAE